MSRRYPRTPWSPPAPVTTADPEDDPMPKIQFTSVTLHKTVPRLDAGMGQATQDTTFFDVKRAGVTIEYDPSTQLVTLSKGTACVSIPLAGVERFGPTIEQAAVADKAAAARAEVVRLANAKAEAEAAEIAALPA